MPDIDETIKIGTEIVIYIIIVIVGILSIKRLIGLQL